MNGNKVSVIKVGGSVLRDGVAYQDVATTLCREIQRGPTRVVVSAAEGVTDALTRLAADGDQRIPGRLLQLHAELAGGPLPSTVAADLQAALAKARIGPQDSLVTWGERASAAALQAWLSRAGFEAPIIELGSPESSSPSLSAALTPGFYVRRDDGDVRCLPRGGSDLSAVLLAAGLGAPVVRLWKAGGGIRLNGGWVTQVSADALIPKLEDPIRPIHIGALALASQLGIDLLLEDPMERFPSTRIQAEPWRVGAFLPPWLGSPRGQLENASQRA